MHLWLTRYDAPSKTLGITILKVLLMEFVLFAILGIAVGWFISFALRDRSRLVSTENLPRRANGE
jgi:hypothetical protein